MGLCSLPVVWPWWQTMVGVMVTSSKGTYASTLCLPGLRLSVLLTSSRSLLIHASAGDSQTLTDKSHSVSCSITLLFLGSWCVQSFVYALQEFVSLVLWKFCNQILLTFKVKSPWEFSPFAGSLGWKVLWGLELSQQCKNFFCIIVLQFYLYNCWNLGSTQCPFSWGMDKLMMVHSYNGV